MFGDDNKIFNIIKIPEDQEILQNDLHTLFIWSDKLLLKFQEPFLDTVAILIAL